MNKSLFAMNTYNTFTVYDNTVEDVLSEAEQELKTLEALWSVTDENSKIYAINHSDGTPVEVNEYTAQLLRFALDMAEQTGGILDITTYPVLTVWGFTTGKYQIPTEEQLVEKMALVGYEKVLLSGNTVTLSAVMEIDLGAVAKGLPVTFWQRLFQKTGLTPANNFVIFVSGEKNSASTGGLVKLRRITSPQEMIDALEGQIDVTIALKEEAGNTGTESTAAGNDTVENTEPADSTASAQEGVESMQIKITVGDTELYATLEDNVTTRTWMEEMPMTLWMSDLYGRERCKYIFY